MIEDYNGTAVVDAAGETIGTVERSYVDDDGAVLGNEFDLTRRLRLDIDQGTLTVAGLVSLVVTLLVMLGGAILGGKLGAGYHRRIDREAGVS